MYTRSILFYCLAIIILSTNHTIGQNQAPMQETDQAQDRAVLSKLNAQFIKNFVTQDAKAHSEIIHPDFVCIENNGSIVGREEYLKNWATDYQNSGLESFTYTDEFIRIFGNVALVRSKSVFTKKQDGKLVTGYSVYTDTYVKEKGRWWCVQAHMTPVRP